jgi:hypothetical protein
MACERNIHRARSGAVAAGVTATGSKISSLAGQLAGRIGQAADVTALRIGRAIAPASNRVLAAVDRPTTIAANLAPALATAALFTQTRVFATGPNRGTLPAVAVAVRLREPESLARQVKNHGRVVKSLGNAALAATMLADLATAAAKQPGGERTLVQTTKRFLLGQRSVEIGLTKSRLTGLLNGRDLLIGARHVVSSTGDVVTDPGGHKWHRGTTVIKTPQGRRTITHVRSLGLPASSYYFDQSLSDAEVAGLVSCQARPQRMAGYVGSIGAVETLAPGWAQAKRAMILTRLHWPTARPAWVAQKDDQPDARKEQVIELKPAPKTTGAKQGAGT